MSEEINAGAETQDNTEVSSAEQTTLTKTEDQQAQETPNESESSESQPVDYSDFTAPEGFEFDQELMGEFKSLAQEANLTQEQAQKFIDLAVKQGQDSFDDSEIRQQWIDDLKTDPDFGGANFDRTVQDARNAVSKFAPDSVVSLLDETGLGDNKDIIVMFAKINKALGEDSHIEGNQGGQSREQSAAEVLYPNLN